MKKILLLIAILYFPFLVFSQNYSFDWVKAFNNTGNIWGYSSKSMTTDKEDNLYVASNYIDSVDLDPTNNFLYIYKGNKELLGSYIVKLDKYGNLSLAINVDYISCSTKSTSV